jgi:hypothetical protein
MTDLGSWGEQGGAAISTERAGVPSDPDRVRKVGEVWKKAADNVLRQVSNNTLAVKEVLPLEAWTRTRLAQVREALARLIKKKSEDEQDNGLGSWGDPV